MTDPWESAKQNEQGPPADPWLPWETSVGPASFVRTLRNVGATPALTFQAAQRDVRYVRSLLFCAITTICAVPVGLFPEIFGRFSIAALVQDVPTVDLVARYGLAGAVAGFAGYSIVSTAVGVLLGALLLMVGLSMLGVPKPPYARCTRAVAYATAISLVLSLVPIAGQPAGFAWGAFVLYAAVAGLFDVPKWKALAATTIYYAVSIALSLAPALMPAPS